MKRLFKRLWWTAISICTLLIVIIIICQFLVVGNASGKTYDDVDSLPHNRYVLLLVTSPITPDGAHNFYFDNRIKAADELYKAGKIDYVIATGGDYTKEHKNGCDEPAAIRDSLVARGIPTERIILDYEGLRTLNSIAKAKEIYGLDSVILISQKYHNERAIYLADHYNLHAVGYNAEPSPIRRNRIKNTIREYLARVKLFIDLTNGLQPNISELRANDFSQLESGYSISESKYNEIKETLSNYLHNSSMSEEEQREFIYELCDTIHPCLHSVFFKYGTKINGFNVEGTFGIAPDGALDYAPNNHLFATLYFSSDSMSFKIIHCTFNPFGDEVPDTLKALDCLVLPYKEPAYPTPNKITLGMSIGDLPFAFIDINFDGTKELLLANPGNGQKLMSTYSAYTLPQIKELDPFEGYTWNRLDEWTEFDYKTQTVVSSLWGRLLRM